MLVRPGYDDANVPPNQAIQSPPLWEKGEPRASISHLVVVAADGTTLGAVVEHELGVRFVATHARVRAMDQSVWPTADYARNAARQLFNDGPCPSPDPLVGKTARNWHGWRRIWDSVRPHRLRATIYVRANHRMKR